MVQDLRKRTSAVTKNRYTAHKKNQSKFSFPKLTLLRTIFHFFRRIFYFFESRIGRIAFVQIVFVIAVGIVLYNLVYLFAVSPQTTNNNFLSSLKIVEASRGQIFYRNIKSGKTIALTSSTSLVKITYDPFFLRSNIEKNVFTLGDVLFQLSSKLNIPYKEIESELNANVTKTTTARYAVLKSNGSVEQGLAVREMRSSDSPLRFNLWLNSEPVSNRVYLEQKSLGNYLGYVQKSFATREEVMQVAQCRAMVEKNELRNTIKSYSGRIQDGEYPLGVYGLEQKFCSELAGLNGRDQLFSEDRLSKDSLVQNGSDIFLTIDSTLQTKAEQLLAETMQRNTLNGKPPRNGTIITISLEDIGSVKAGEVLALASAPSADPNNYDTGKYLETGAFQNVAVADRYEPGSVIKPLMVATALNEWNVSAKNSVGERTGLPADWKFVSADPNKRTYTEPNGNTYTISNVIKMPPGPIEIKDCLYNSLNTCMSEIETHISNSEDEVRNNIFRHDKTYDYFVQRFGFQRPTLADVPPAASANLGNFELKNNSFQYANFSFGQGFEITPMQLARAYSAIARYDGRMVEPYTVGSIRKDDGMVEDATNTLNQRISSGQPVFIVKPETAKQLNEWLEYSLNGYGNQAIARGKPASEYGRIDSYPMAGKTGTSQVGRQTEAIKVFGCNRGESPYDCNSRLGITDQTYINFGPVGDKYVGKYPRILTIVKLSEPQQGNLVNFALFNLGTPAAEMSRFTLEYLGVPPNL